jgi:hypothetical protein
MSIDPYYTDKLHSWTLIKKWMTEPQTMDFKTFCSEYKIWCHAYVPYIIHMLNMDSDEKRLNFINRRLENAKNLLEEHIRKVEVKRNNCSHPDCRI